MSQGVLLTLSCLTLYHKHFRILQFIETGVLDTSKLDQILIRHDLLAKWEQFGDKFLRK